MSVRVHVLSLVSSRRSRRGCCSFGELYFRIEEQLPFFQHTRHKRTLALCQCRPLRLDDVFGASLALLLSHDVNFWPLLLFPGAMETGTALRVMHRCGSHVAHLNDSCHRGNQACNTVVSHKRTSQVM